MSSPEGVVHVQRGAAALRVYIQLLIVVAVAAALRGGLSVPAECLVGLALLAGCAAVDVELGRWAEGGRAGQRPHKGLSAWPFAAALVVPCPLAVAVVVPVYVHARWRGIKVPVLKWAGSAAIVALAATSGAAVARALGAAPDEGPLATTAPQALALAAGAGVFIAVEALLFAACTWVGDPADEAWLRAQLRTRAFYLTELGVLAGAVVTAALLVSSPWLLLFVLPGYAMVQRAVLHEPLRRQAAHDGKTGLLNYVTWRELVVRELGRGRPGALLLLDLDHFKAVNDIHGHLAGDAVLADVSRLLDEVLRERDLAGRFGGEEFCVLLPDTTPGDAGVVAERLRERVATLPLSVPGLRMTVSVGVCFLLDGRCDLDEALAAADRALYAAKRDGRDRVVYGDLAVAGY